MNIRFAAIYFIVTLVVLNFLAFIYLASPAISNPIDPVAGEVVSVVEGTYLQGMMARSGELIVTHEEGGQYHVSIFDENSLVDRYSFGEQAALSPVAATQQHYLISGKTPSAAMNSTHVIVEDFVTFGSRSDGSETKIDYNITLRYQEEGTQYQNYFLGLSQVVHSGSVYSIPFGIGLSSSGLGEKSYYGVLHLDADDGTAGFDMLGFEYGGFLDSFLMSELENGYVLFTSSLVEEGDQVVHRKQRIDLGAEFDIISKESENLTCRITSCMPTNADGELAVVDWNKNDVSIKMDLWTSSGAESYIFDDNPESLSVRSVGATDDRFAVSFSHSSDGFPYYYVYSRNYGASPVELDANPLDYSEDSLFTWLVSDEDNLYAITEHRSRESPKFVVIFQSAGVTTVLQWLDSRGYILLAIFDAVVVGTAYYILQRRQVILADTELYPGND